VPLWVSGCSGTWACCHNRWNQVHITSWYDWVHLTVWWHRSVPGLIPLLRAVQGHVCGQQNRAGDGLGMRLSRAYYLYSSCPHAECLSDQSNSLIASDVMEMVFCLSFQCWYQIDMESLSYAVLPPSVDKSWGEQQTCYCIHGIATDHNLNLGTCLRLVPRVHPTLSLVFLQAAIVKDQVVWRTTVSVMR